MTDPETEAGRGALREFRRWRRGALLADSRSSNVRFVTDPGSGAVVAPVERGAINADELVLFVPEESDEALQVLLEPLREPVREELIDRWRIHHGDPPASVATPDPKGQESTPMMWASFDIEGARLGGALIDGDALMVANPLARIEARLCKRLNADRRLLWHICKMKTGVDVPADVSGGPVCVGVDPEGLHVRGKLGVLRVEFDRPPSVAGAGPDAGPGDDVAAIEREAEAQVEALVTRAATP